jgi:TetR/AcrR family transcriptional repressor of nem operon
MPRPRSYERAVVVHAAAQAFLERGYEGTGLDELERATGLSRSSIYLAFGSKRRLFDIALEDYCASFVAERLGPVEAPGAQPLDAMAFFVALAELFRSDHGSRGCLMINTIVELGGRDQAVSQQGAEFFDRYRVAFANALDGTARKPLVARRAELLASGAMGVWATSRVDPTGAARAADAIASEISSWGRSEPSASSPRS